MLACPAPLNLPPCEPVLPLDAVVKSLRSSIVDVRLMLNQIESQEGWFRFSPFFLRAIENLKIQSYPLLYTNELAIAGVLLRGFMGDSEIKEFCSEVEVMTLAERGVFLQDITQTTSELMDAIVIPKTPAQEKAALQEFQSLSETEQAEVRRLAQHVFSFLLSSFHQNLAVMVHGEKLTSLVSQAMVGNDDAYAKAIQIDRRILTEIPYFKDRFARSQMEGDHNFSDLISYRLKTPPYRGKIRYKALWYTFSILEAAGWLSHLRYREILEVCDEAGLDGYRCRIQSEKHLGNRIREYREFQKRGIVTTT